MDIKDFLKDAVYAEFIEDKKEYNEEDFNLFFKNTKDNRYLDSFVLDHKLYGQNIKIVSNRLASFIFIEKNKERVILMISGQEGFDLGTPMIVGATSVMKIEIIASDAWKRENDELLKIVNLISSNTSNIPKEIYNRGYSLIDGFEEHMMQSPILYYLSRDNFIKHKSRIGTKTKETFLSGVLKVIINNMVRKESVFSKDLENIRKDFYRRMLSKLVRKSTRHYFIEDIQKRGLSVIIDFIGVKLMDSVIYDKNEWNTYFQTEFKQMLLPEFQEYIFEVMTDNDLDKSLESALKYELNEIDADVTRENMNRILERMMSFSQEKLNVDIFNNTLIKYNSELPEILIEYEGLTYKEEKKEVIPF